MAESVIGLYKAKCVRHEGPVRTLDDLELRTLTWVHWFNHTRLHSSLGHLPPVEFEQAHHHQNNPAQQAAVGGQSSGGIDNAGISFDSMPLEVEVRCCDDPKFPESIRYSMGRCSPSDVR